MSKEELIQQIIKRVLEETAKSTVCTNNDDLLVLDMQNCANTPTLTTQSIYIKNLTIDALVEIALGCTTTPATKLVRTAIMQGVSLYTTVDDIELYSYKETANKNYYSQFNGYLEFLKNSGLTVAESQPALYAMLSQNAETPSFCTPSVCAPSVALTFERKVLTEQALTKLRLDSGITDIAIGEKTIVTDLAKDYAQKHNISIARSGGGKV